MDERELIVIGGGISGLSLAWHAARAGVRPLVLEAGPRVGGCLDSRRTRDGFWFELGAHTLYNSYRGVLDIAEGCDEPVAIIPRSDVRKRFGLLRDGQVKTLGPLSVFRQFGWWELATRAPRALFASKQGKTTREHFSRIVGANNYQRVLAPFLSAVPSQAVDEFPATGPGSLFKKRPRRKDVIKSFTFDGGVGALVAAIAGSGIDVRVDSPVRALAERNGRFHVTAGDGDELVAPRVAVAVDPGAAAELVRGCRPELAATLGRIELATVDSVGVVVPRRATALPELAFLVPVDDIFWSAVTRDPVPDDDWRAFTFHFRPGHSAEVRRERIAAVLGVAASELADAVERRTVLPSPARDHAAVVSELDKRLTGDTLALTGNYFDGLAIEDCVARSTSEWTRIASSPRN